MEINIIDILTVEPVMQYMKTNNTIKIIIERSLIIINRNITMNITIKPNVIIADRNYYNKYNK